MTLFKKLQQSAAVVLLLAALLAGSVVLTRAEAVGVTSAAGIVTTSTNLNVRNAAGLNSAIISKLPPGAYVTLIYKTGGWWYVEYDAGRYGYVSAGYIRYVYGTDARRVSTGYGSLNVRSGPGTSYSIINSLPNRQTVLVLSETNGWYNVLANGTLVGYVHSAYLKSMMAWPVPVGTAINQYFQAGSHKGIDIDSSVQDKAGDAVIAAQTGTVAYAGWLNGYGYVVYINSVYNGRPIQTRYAHLARAPFVSAGDAVGVGQRIGLMGSTGTSSGVHLHFEVRVRDSWSACVANADSTPVNPFNYL